MAEKIDPKHRGIAREDLNMVMRETMRGKALASEYASNTGQFVKTQIERLSMDRTAFGMVCRLHGKEDDQRQAIIRALIDYCFKLGYFDQIDAFDDMLGTLEEIVAHIRGNSNRAPGDSLIGELAGN